MTLIFDVSFSDIVCMIKQKILRLFKFLIFIKNENVKMALKYIK
ncbi:hypothetical protein HMPREF9352_1416 [Streptococcus gallolyticus subsp. gallolyticus TX20005]|nr:hypothetical protein HMPREF9352_1416 [Streptococcus gallolyticus subsp. gallolyticus TX20005]